MEKVKCVTLAIIVLTPIVGTVLVLRYRWFLKKLREEENESQKSFKPMLSEKVPYEAYQRIAAKGPVKTVPVCKGIDFLELLLEHSDDNNPNNIESNLANVDVGETIL